MIHQKVSLLVVVILDKYGFKGSFFTVCTYVNNAISRLGDRLL